MKTQHSHLSNYYEYDPDGNSFAGVGFHGREIDDERDDGAIVTNLHFDDTPRAANWRPLTCHGWTDNPPRIGDFPSVSNYRRVPMMSERAWIALAPLIGGVCEALPVHHPFSGNYHLVHILRTVAALDELQSVVARRSPTDQRIYKVYQYSFRKELIDGLHIFKLPNAQGSALIVDEEFRRIVEDNNLQGLRFQRLPTL
jgi:hypothetical protein